MKLIAEGDRNTLAAGLFGTENTALQATGVSASLGGTPVLHGIDLALAAGRWTSIVGPNGAGK